MIQWALWPSSITVYCPCIVDFCAEFEIFHRMLCSWHELRRPQSVFQQRTDDSSALQYFQVKRRITSVPVWCIINLCKKCETFVVSSQFYGCLSQQQNMLQDYLRTSTYQKAILLNDVDFKDKVCVYVLHRLVYSDLSDNITSSNSANFILFVLFLIQVLGHIYHYLGHFLKTLHIVLITNFQLW